MMVTFKLLEDQHTRGIEVKINTHLRTGWKMSGTIFSNNGKFYQGLTKTHRKDKKPD